MYILIFLNSEGKGTDIAKEEAAAWDFRTEKCGTLLFIKGMHIYRKAHGLWDKKGYVDMVRGPVREMLHEMGAAYAHSFLEHTVQTYQLSEEDIMQMYSAVYAGPGKTKVEKEFYRSFVCTWLEQDKDGYIAAIEKISKDMRKKIFAVLKRENLYTA